MSSVPPIEPNDPVPPRLGREIRWDAVAAIIASLVGFLALIVAGYTAYIERYIADIQTKQVQAQVWPWLVAGNNDNERSIEILNKGVGPAIVRSAQVFVDGSRNRTGNTCLRLLARSRMSIRNRPSTPMC